MTSETSRSGNGPMNKEIACRVATPVTIDQIRPSRRMSYMQDFIGPLPQQLIGSETVVRLSQGPGLPLCEKHQPVTVWIRTTRPLGALSKCGFPCVLPIPPK